MGLSISRTTEPLRFDVGIGSAGYADIMTSPGAGEAQKSLLPGSTTVSRAIDEIFPRDKDVSGEIMHALVAGNRTVLLTSSGFSETARNTVASLRERASEAAGNAAREIESLLADGDLLERYRLALLET